MRILAGMLATCTLAAAAAADEPSAVVAPVQDVQEQQTDAAPESSAPETTEREVRRGDGGSGRSSDRLGTSRSPMSRRWRNPSDADIALFIEVAGELNPEWRSSLLELKTKDPEAFRKSIGVNGGRLWQLVELRERNPGLYKLRIEEIQTQGQLRQLGHSYRTALEEERTGDAAALLEQIQALATRQVDIQMRVRGEELAAMAEALERLRKDLLEQATDRIARAQLIVDRVIEPRPEGESSGERSPGLIPGLGGGGRPLRGGQDAHSPGDATDEPASPVGR